MGTIKRTLRDRFSWLYGGTGPFCWLLLTPFVTVPLSLFLYGQLLRGPQEVGLPGDDCGGDWLCFTHYEYYEVVPTLLVIALPGLVNLVAFSWAFSSGRLVKIAGIVAGLTGLAGLSLGVMVLLTHSRLTSPYDGASYFQIGSEFPVFIAGVVPWVVSIVVWFVLAFVTASWNDD